MKKVILVLVVAILISACAVPTSKDVADRWVGRNITQAIAVLGPPQSATTIPGGITIYTWEQTYGSANAISRATCRKGLHVDNNGMIVDASQLSESLLCE